MKALLVFLYLVLAAPEHAGVEIPVELPGDTPQGQLVQFQLEEVALAVRYRAGHPKMIEVRSKIAALLALPEIFNDVYYFALTGNLALLREERARLMEQFRPANPRITTIDRQIAFAENTLADRK